MAVLLEGGCRVADMREDAPQVKGELISLRVFEVEPGLSMELRNPDVDEVLFLLGSCRLLREGVAQVVERQTGIFVRAGERVVIENPGSATVALVGVQCPATKVPPKAVVVNLSKQRAMPTADRWYRVLIDSEVTQFVGSIPPGRAPDHFHEYEEVLFILRGEGRMWAGATSTPIAYGSCIYLPRRQVHCVENTGKGELRLLGVFYPAGSPAVRYETTTQNP
jgi:mannose-6-phosphate isomerase-like protein (cupin superfamily)